MNTDPALQDLRPIGRRALISVLQGNRLASHGKRETPHWHAIRPLHRARYLCDNCKSGSIL